MDRAIEDGDGFVEAAYASVDGGEDVEAHGEVEVGLGGGAAVESGGSLLLEWIINVLGSLLQRKKAHTLVFLFVSFLCVWFLIEKRRRTVAG